jgi:hypothetical protein
MSLIDKMKGVRYRARIFDHNLHITTIEVPDRGQRYVTIVVKGKQMGFKGEETKLAFKINPDIPPKIFGGFIQELDFDIKDSCPMADLVDVVPDLIYEINENYKVMAEVKKDEGIESLMEPAPAPDGTTEKKDDEKKAPAPKKPPLIRTARKLYDILNQIKSADYESEKRALIKQCLDLCQEYPKLIYWLPKEMTIYQEVNAIVSQSRIKRNGVIPSYYIRQSNAEIAEKVLQRPQTKTGWEQVVLILGVIIGFLILAALIFKASGMI